MAQHLHLFETVSAFTEQYNGEGYKEPWVSYTEENGKVVYNKNPLEEYLTFEILSGGTMYWKKAGQSSYWDGVSIEYSKNNGETWTSIMSSSAGTTFQVSSGDVILFRGNNSRYSTIDSIYSNDSCIFSAATGVKFNIRGNIMSLINSENFSTLNTLPTSCTFSRMFDGCEGLIDAGGLLLPATATTINCYSTMFYDCKNMIAAPKLPATTMAVNCYWRMFLNCTSLTTAPVLLARELEQSCYQYMFNGCSNLSRITCLATDMSATDCLKNWVYGVAASGTFVKKSGVTWPSGNSGIPDGWIVEEV